MSVALVMWNALWLFQAIPTPDAVKAVTMAMCPAETIGVVLGTLNASDQLRHIQEILSRIERFFASSCFACFFVSICSGEAFRGFYTVFDGMFLDRFVSSQWNKHPFITFMFGIAKS